MSAIPLPGFVRTYSIAALGFGFALVGGAIALAVGIPIPWLLGALLLSLALGAFGRRPGFPDPIRDLAFLMLGYFIGSTASAEFFGSVTLWVPSVLVSIALIPMITLSSAFVIHRMTDLEPNEALLCAVPGSLPFVVAASEDMGLRTHLVILFQSIRLLSLTFALPFALGFWGVPSETTAPAALASIPQGLNPADVLILIGSLGFAVVCAVVARRLKVPAPTFIGPMMGVAAAKLGGVPLPDLPPLLLFGSQAALGWIMGARFDAIPFRDLRRMALACFVGLGVGVGVALAACAMLVWLTGLDAKELMLGLAPGAIETVTSIALDQGVDPLFVSTHQIARMLSIPLIATAMLVIGRRLLALVTKD